MIRRAQCSSVPGAGNLSVLLCLRLRSAISNRSLMALDFSKIPPLIFWACVSLILAFLVIFFVFLAQVKRIRKQLRTISAGDNSRDHARFDTRMNGLSGTQLEELRVRGDQLSGKPKTWYRRIDAQLERYTSPQNREGWFVTEHIGNILPYEDTVGSQLNANFYNAFPALLTGVGLLLTFTAILIALYHVHYDSGNSAHPVSGIEDLINGLSGKFFSSVVALALSVLFTITSRVQFRRLRTSYDLMVENLGGEIPYLSTSRILLDIQRFAADQTVSVSNISSDVVDRFVNAFRNDVTPGLAQDMSRGVAEILQLEFRPTMQRMGEILAELNTSIVNLESQKQESIGGEIRGLLQSVESSMVRALEKMGADFHQALAGAATQEFGNIQGTLGATRDALSEMIGQFGRMQAGFEATVQRADDATAEQRKSGIEQTEKMIKLMDGLMTQLQTTADQNLSSVRNQLTLVVSDLSSQVSTLSKEMMSAAEKVTQSSQDSAREVLDRTGEWSEATARRLEELLRGIENRSTEFQKAAQVLMQVHEQLTVTIGQGNVSLKNMAEASTQVKAYTTALGGQTDIVKGFNQQQVQIAGQLKDATGNLRLVFEQHGQLLKEYQRVFDEYRTITDGLDEGLATIFTEINRGMRDYAQGVENNFREIVRISNQSVPEISKLLQTQVQELSGQLEELTSVISKSVEKTDGRVR